MNFKLIFKAIVLALCVFSLSKYAFAMEKEQQGPKDIFEALDNRDLQAVTNFLDQGMCIDIRNDRGFTPLWVAIFRSDENLVRLLLQRGADMFAEVKDFRPLIEYATTNSIEQLILEEINRKDRELLRKASVWSSDSLLPRVRAIRSLMCPGFRWNWRRSYRRDFIESLLLKLKVYNTIFEAADAYPAPNIKAVEWFLDNGEDINCKNTTARKTLLHIAIGDCIDVALCNMCLQRGIDVDAQDFTDSTALHNAIVLKQKHFVRLLLQHNARLDIKNRLNKTPLDLAQTDEDILHIINAEVESQKQKKENSRFPQAFKRLITEGLLQRHPFVSDANSAAILASNDCMLANAFALQRDKKAHCIDFIKTGNKPVSPLQQPMPPVDEKPYWLRFTTYRLLKGLISLGQNAADLHDEKIKKYN
jgi:ankyrin repeat protein